MSKVSFFNVSELWENIYHGGGTLDCDSKVIADVENYIMANVKYGNTGDEENIQITKKVFIPAIYLENLLLGGSNHKLKNRTKYIEVYHENAGLYGYGNNNFVLKTNAKGEVLAVGIVR